MEALLTPPPRGGRENVAINSAEVQTLAAQKRRSRLPPTPARPRQPPAAACSSQRPHSPGTALLFDVRVNGTQPLVDSNGSTKARLYLVRLVCRHRPGLSWEVTRRYSEFDALRAALRDELHEELNAGYPADSSTDELPSLPPKLPSLLLSPPEQQRRILGLQRFCVQLLSLPSMVARPRVGAFFELDFGLWHVESVGSAAPLLLDPAQRAAALVLQSHARGWRAQRKARELRRLLTLSAQLSDWRSELEAELEACTPPPAAGRASGWADGAADRPETTQMSGAEAAAMPAAAAARAPLQRARSWAGSTAGRPAHRRSRERGTAADDARRGGAD